MRIRITRQPPDYGVDGSWLRVGRIYNLESSLASALLADGCAELYDTLPPEARRDRTVSDVWRSNDRTKPWSRILRDPNDE